MAAYRKPVKRYHTPVKDVNRPIFGMKEYGKTSGHEIRMNIKIQQLKYLFLLFKISFLLLFAIYDVGSVGTMMR